MYTDRQRDRQTERCSLHGEVPHYDCILYRSTTDAAYKVGTLRTTAETRLAVKRTVILDARALLPPAPAFKARFHLETFPEPARLSLAVAAKPMRSTTPTSAVLLSSFTTPTLPDRIT